MLENPEQFKTPEKSAVEEKKHNVIDVLKRNENAISGFNFMTNSVNGSGFWQTSEKKENAHVQYDSRYKSYFDIVPLKDSDPIDPGMEEVNGKRPYYIFDKEVKRLTFMIPLGQGFADNRAGNCYMITLKFKKEELTDKSELITKVSDLLKTLNYYYNDDIKGDRYKIAKQGLPVIEAFDEISRKYQDGNLSIEQTIEGYKKIIEEYEQKA